MARKRKRLNKRVAVVLVALGSVFLLLMLAVAIKGGGSLLDRFLPRNPKPLIAAARKALEGDPRDFETADQAFRKAIGAAQASGAPDLKSYYYEYARMNYQWHQDGAGLTRTQRRERHLNAFSLLRRALSLDDRYVEAQQFLCDLHWELVERHRQGWAEFIEEANKLLKLTPDDHATLFRRARAKAAMASKELPGQTTKDAIADFNAAIARVKQALAAQQKAIESAKDDPQREQLSKERDKLNKRQAEYWLGLIGFLARLEGRNLEVEQAFDRAVQALPDDADILIAHGAYLRSKALRDLSPKFRPLLTMDPALREKFLEAAKEGEMAARRFMKAAGLKPAVLDALDPAARQGRLAAQQLQVALPILQAATQCLQQAVEHDPVSGYIAMAGHYHGLNESDKALALFRKASEVDKLDPRPYLGRAQIHRQQGELETAAAVLREGLAIVKNAGETQPATEEEAETRAVGRNGLNYRLADTLLRMVESRHEGREKLLAEARGCLEEMISQGLRGPGRDSIAGRIAYAEGKADEAVPLLENAYDAYKEGGRFDLALANLLINVYLSRNLPGKAEAIIDRFLSLRDQADNVPVLMAKVRLLMGYRDFDKAERLVEHVLKVEPNSAEALNAKMELLTIAGDKPTLPAGLQPTRQTLRVLLDRAAALWQDGQQDEAVAYAEQLYERAPTSRAVVLLLSQMYQQLRRTADAEKLLDEALKQHPDDEALQAQRKLIGVEDKKERREALLKLADQKPPLDRELEKATIEAMFGNQDGYLQHLQEAAKIDPNAWGVVERLFRLALTKQDWKLADECVGRARSANLDGSKGKMYETRLAMVRKDYDSAIAAALEALRERPDRKDARVWLGNAYLSKRAYEEAYQAFKIVADNDPGHAPAWIGLAAVTAAQGKVDEHRTYVNKAYQLAPQHPLVRSWKMRIDEETASPEQLIARREKLLLRDPNDLGNLASLGILYERVKNNTKAENMYYTLYQKSPDKLYGAGLLGQFYLRCGRLEDMERIIEPLLDTWKDRVGVRVLYGQLLMPVDQGKAKGFFEKAIEADVKDPRGHQALARYWAELGQWGQAAQSMTNCVRLRREDVAGERELIRYEIEAREYEPAARRLDELLRRDPTDAGALALKGELAFRQGQRDEALRLFTQAIRDNPTFTVPLILRAKLYLVQGEPDKAKADLQEAKRLSDRIEVAMQLAAVYEALRDYDNAELVYREVRGEQASYRPAIDRLITIYTRRQNWRLLEELLADAHRLYPGNAGYWMAEAGMWQARDNGPNKLAALAKAVQLAPDHPVPLQAYLLALQEANQHEEVLTVSWKYLDEPGFVQWLAAMRAGSLAKLGRHAEADKLFLRAVQTVSAEHVFVVVQQLQQAYGLDGAVERFKKWLSAEEKNWRLHLVLGMLRSEAGALAEAARSLEASRDLAPGAQPRLLANRYLGATYYRMKKYAEAEKAYLACLEVQGNDYQVLNNLAYLYTDLDKPQAALPFSARAANLAPNNARVLDTYGWTLAKIGRFAEAERVLLRAVQLEAPLTASRYHLGWVYEQIGRYEDAWKQYKQGFETIRTRTDDPLYELLKQAAERVGPKAKAGSAK